jgi:glycosyltransferase involved in cell wall biosynthesis
MKLLLVTHYMPPHHGGIERVAEDHALTAAAEGWDVSWVSSRVPRATPAIQELDWGRAERVSCLNALEVGLGVPYPLWLPGAGRWLRRLVREADLVHVHDLLYIGSTLALAAAHRLKRPCLLTQHVGFVPYQSRLLNAVQRLAYRWLGGFNLGRADAVAWCNRGALEWMVRVCGLNRPSIYLPNGVDTERFSPPQDAAERAALRRKHDLPAHRPVALFVGRLVPKKGAQLVAEARSPHYHLLLVGERGSLVFEPGADLELRPFVARDALVELLRAVDMLVLPSRGEGFPLVAQEAMACGLPVVLGDDPSYAEQVDEGAAVFIEPSAANLRQVLGRLASRPDERARLGGAARASALKHWGAGRCRRRLLEVYHALATGGPLPAEALGGGP